MTSLPPFVCDTHTGYVTLMTSVDIHDMGKPFFQTPASSSVKYRFGAGLNTLKLRKEPNMVTGTEQTPYKSPFFLSPNYEAAAPNQKTGL